MKEFPPYDWNAVAAGMHLVPDEVVRTTLSNADGGDTLLSTWESIVQQTSAMMGLPTGDLLVQNKMIREVLLGFFKAEAIRRGF